MNFVVQRIIRNLTFLFATLVLVGIGGSYFFYPLGAFIIAINGAILYYFARA